MDSRRRRRLSRALPALLLLPALACIQNDGRRFNPFRSLIEVSEGQEQETGAAVDAEIARHVRLIDDPVVLGFINELGQAMVRTLEPQPFIYRFRVVVDPNLNAFALPAGYIYLHSGTILQAGSLDELAGVVGHEIAHVKARHYKRGRERSALPDLLSQVAGVAAAAATGEGGLAVLAAGANVALQLQFSREFEREADELGATFMVRTGHDPAGMTRFFERIVAAEKGGGLDLPPYLYSHPEVEDRIAAAQERERELRVTGRGDPALERRFDEAQLRLALLVQSERSTWHANLPYDRSHGDRGLRRAEQQLEAGDALGALAELERAEAHEPHDPRLPFRRGELLEARGRDRDAIEAWRRALALDPNVALTYFRLGRAYKRRGDRHAAAYYLGQAERRFAPGGSFQQRARLDIETLTFPPLLRAGLSRGGEAEDLGSEAREEFRAEDGGVAWWAELSPRYRDRRDQLRVRWTEPSGRIAAEMPARAPRGPYVTALLALTGPEADRHGIWRVEALLGDEVIDRRTFRLVP